MKYFIIILILLSGSDLFSQFVMPESAVFSTQMNGWLISDVGNQSAADGKIFIKRGDSAPTVFFSQGLTDPKGLEIHEGILFVADVTKLVMVSISDSSLFESLTVSGASFLNDIEYKGASVFYLSDTQLGKIFKFDFDDMMFTEVKLDNPVSFPNGLYFDSENNRLLAASFSMPGKLYSISFTGGSDTDGKVETVFSSDKYTFLDGIFFNSRQNFYYVSSWNSNTNPMQKGKLFNLDKQLKQINGDFQGLYSGPADIMINEKTGVIAVPEMAGGKVTFVDISSNVDENSKEIEIYPNPSTDVVNISSDLSFDKFMLYDSLGSLISQHLKFAGSNNNLSVNLPKLTAGVYILVGAYENKTKTFKIIIK